MFMACCVFIDQGTILSVVYQWPCGSSSLGCPASSQRIQSYRPSCVGILSLTSAIGLWYSISRRAATSEELCLLLSADPLPPFGQLVSALQACWPRTWSSRNCNQRPPVLQKALMPGHNLGNGGAKCEIFDIHPTASLNPDTRTVRQQDQQQRSRLSAGQPSEYDVWSLKYSTLFLLVG